ncbi:MAG: hypothetical protein AAGA70_09245 [Pseudomonadota bacterium]
MPATYSDRIANATAELNAAARALSEELRAYPTPVSGCDVQYNHLIAERTRVAAALRELTNMPFIATPRIPVEGARVESR